MKRTIICLLILALTVIFLSSCALRGIGDREPYILFDENGNMLCDYYVLNVWLCDSKPAADGEYKYAAHRYHQIDGINGWMDLVTYGEELKTIEHAMALYSSYGVNTESVTFEHYGKPNGNAKVLKMVLRSELKNGGVYSYEGFPYFCAEVIGISKDFITVSPLDGTVEKYVADTLSVSSDTTELGVSADELSVGDIIRIFYDGGIFKDGINIRGAHHFELLTTENNGFTISFLGMTPYTDVPSFEGAVNGSVFTDGTLPGALPAYLVTSADGLAAQKDIYSNRSYVVTDSFNYLTANYTDEYFSKNALIVAYLPSPSISYTYDIAALTVNSGRLTLRVAETNSPPVPYPEKYLYAVCVEVDAQTASTLTSFDVELIN